MRTGSVLYAADGEPVVALIGATTPWRTLRAGVDPGLDVEQLERALTALGYGDDVTVDRSFTTATAAAVQEWEDDLTRPDPDGEVEPTDLVLLPGSGAVQDASVAFGGRVGAGSMVLRIDSQATVATVQVDADGGGDGGNADTATIWRAGRVVRVVEEGADRSQPRAGTVARVGGDVVDGQVEVTVRSAMAGPPAGTPITVELVAQRRSDVLSVPVAALFGNDEERDRYLVRVAGLTTPVPVEVGLVAGGRAEITSGLTAGQRVQLPG
ncbi:MAG: peptidoglycan-binding protein [Angustibacter sp.]